MNDDRIDQLERQLAELELRLSARVEAAIEAASAANGLAVDALALLASRDRAAAERLLMMRRLTLQVSQAENRPSVETQKLMVASIETALDLADSFARAGPLGPR